MVGPLRVDRLSTVCCVSSTPAPVVVAIDGPSGSGKSSVSKAVARELGLAYLDTGAMYRAVTWWCLDRGVDLDDRCAVASAAESMPLQIGLDPAAPTVEVAGQDIGMAIREPRIAAAVSAVATNLDVREVLRHRQREIIAGCRRSHGGVVAEGRDITTVVAPDADVRVLLTASPAARLARRARDDHGEATAAAIQATHDLVVGRDAADSTVVDFTAPAEGVTLVDTSDLGFEESVAAVLAVVAASTSNRPW